MRNRHYKQIKPQVDNQSLPEVKEVESVLELPKRYIMFPDDLEYAVARISQIEERLRGRNIHVVKPLTVYRFNKMLAFEAEKI